MIVLSLGRYALWPVFLSHAPSEPRPEPPPDTASEVQRLASTAPHMLADIGLRRDPARCTLGAEVWVRGDVAVTLRRSSERMEVQACLSAVAK